ncbi:MAG: plasmid mobilization protein [Longimicrobiales bacterium]|jgi:hypothetical protein
MSGKTSQLQIPVSPEEKRELKLLAERSGLSTSAYVLSTALPRASPEFSSRIQVCHARREHLKPLSDLGLCLMVLCRRQAVSTVDFGELSPFSSVHILRGSYESSVHTSCE